MLSSLSFDIAETKLYGNNLSLFSMHPQYCLSWLPQFKMAAYFWEGLLGNEYWRKFDQMHISTCHFLHFRMMKKVVRKLKYIMKCLKYQRLWHPAIRWSLVIILRAFCQHSLLLYLFLPFLLLISCHFSCLLFYSLLFSSPLHCSAQTYLVCLNLPSYSVVFLYFHSISFWLVVQFSVTLIWRSNKQCETKA